MRTELPFIVSWKLLDTITAERAKELKLESERVGELGLRYRSRRSPDWLKMKNPAGSARGEARGRRGLGAVMQASKAPADGGHMSRSWFLS